VGIQTPGEGGSLIHLANFFLRPNSVPDTVPGAKDTTVNLVPNPVESSYLSGTIHYDGQT
jgi:hypothetical protein